MALDLTGTLIESFPTQQIKETFKKREFVIETTKDIGTGIISDFIKFQLTQQKCDLLDVYKVGDQVKVHFNLRGSKWTKPDGTISYITNLEAWRLEKADGASAQPVNNTSTAAAAPPQQPQYNASDLS
jgi:hypothetical protein